MSFADARDRHVGLSHHSATVLRLAARERVVVAVPELPPEQAARLRTDLELAGVDRRHDLVTVPAPDVLELFARFDLRVAVDGRPVADDPALFQAAVAAGTLAAERTGRRVADGSTPERLVNLTANVVGDPARAEPRRAVGARRARRYPDDKAVVVASSSVSKETLRELGIPIRVETVDGFGAEQAYRIHPDDYYLPELALTEAELAALHVAVTVVRLEGDAGTRVWPSWAGCPAQAPTPRSPSST